MTASIHIKYDFVGSLNRASLADITDKERLFSSSELNGLFKPRRNFPHQVNKNCVWLLRNCFRATCRGAKCKDRVFFCPPPLKRVLTPQGIPATAKKDTIQKTDSETFIPKDQALIF